MSEVALQFELSLWREAGMSPQVWWRDDDAVTHTRELDRLARMTGAAGIEVLLAVIPAYADKSLADYVSANPHLRPCVHGWSHSNHEPAGVKRAELGNARQLDEVIADVARGRERLGALFGGRLVNVLVPPWNRMRSDLAAHLMDAGIEAFSTFGHKLVYPSSQANTHVDVMDWKASGGKAGKHLDVVQVELAEALSVSRQNGGYPVGLLTHHLVHDETAWRVLQALVATEELQWCGFPNPAPPVV